MKIDEIAKMAGVSKSAVSLALNDKPGISDETRERIMKIVREQGYIPRSIVDASQVYGTSKALRLVACVKSEVVPHKYECTSFFSELVTGIEKQCKSAGYALLYSTIEGKNLAAEIETLENDYKSRGTILLGTNLSEDEIKTVRNFTSSLVIVDNCYDYMPCNFVVMNNMQGTYYAARHLIELGHKKIGYVQSRTRVSNFKMRKHGFIRALNLYNHALPDKYIYTVGPDIEQAKTDFGYILPCKDLPTAIFCESDYMAIGVIKALLAQGINIPEDVSIIGFDNVAQSKVVTPELTTVHVEKELLGLHSVRRLLEVIQDSDSATIKINIDTRLIVRNSCKKYSGS